MCRKRNSQTDFVRATLKVWMMSNKLEKFSVYDVLSIFDNEESLTDFDISKSISNELQRLEHVGLLISRPGNKTDGAFTGRPPRMFTKVYCSYSLALLKVVSDD